MHCVEIQTQNISPPKEYAVPVVIVYTNTVTCYSHHSDKKTSTNETEGLVIPVKVKVAYLSHLPKSTKITVKNIFKHKLTSTKRIVEEMTAKGFWKLESKRVSPFGKVKTQPVVDTGPRSKSNQSRMDERLGAPSGVQVGLKAEESDKS